jgi:hypothetical protein
MYYEMPVITSNELSEDQCEAFRRHPGKFNDMVRVIFAAGVNQGQKQPPGEETDLSANNALAPILAGLLSAIESGDVQRLRKLTVTVRHHLNPVADQSAQVAVARRVVDEPEKNLF